MQHSFGSDDAQSIALCAPTDRGYHAHHHTAGQGHVHQGRYKSFPVQDDVHFHVLCPYVERNSRRVELVERAEDWRWVLCIARLCRVSPHHGYCPVGRCPVRQTGFTVSTNRWATKNSMWLARRTGGAVPSGKRTGSSRSPVGWTSNRRNGHADAQKAANLNRETKQRVLTPGMSPPFLPSFSLDRFDFMVFVRGHGVSMR